MFLQCNVLLGISPVEDLQYNFTTNNSVLITWSPPANNIPTESPLIYQVLVIDEDGDAILNATTTNTNITTHNVTDCDTFDISVTVLLAQYTSIDNAVSIESK